MKKPSKPRSKAARRPKAQSTAAAQGRSGRSALGADARNFLARAHHAVAPQAGWHIAEITPALRRTAPAATARVFDDSFPQRDILALLLLPFLLLATMLTVSQSLRHTPSLGTLIPPAADIAVPPPVVSRPPPSTLALSEPALRLPATPPAIDIPRVALAEPALRLPATPPAIDIPRLALAEPAMRLPLTPPTIDIPRLALAEPAMRLPATPPAIDIPRLALAEPAMRLPARPPAIDIPRLALAEPAMRLPLTPPAIDIPRLALAEPALRLPPTPPALTLGPESRICLAQPEFTLAANQRPSMTRVALASDASDPAELGRKLAEAARAQTRQFVIYSDKYRRLAYPLGDVAPLFGVCTDVIIRAYRSIGVDLQVEVKRSGVGSGDTSIDHRRTETLRRFFARSGEALPITTFPEDYKPGDIVTYHRPQNRGSRSHIAIVSDTIGPSGRPMIIHNRGWGPQIEDALFVDQITGHYRYQGPTSARALQEAHPVRPHRKPAARAAEVPRRPVIRTAARQP